MRSWRGILGEAGLSPEENQRLCEGRKDTGMCTLYSSYSTVQCSAVLCTDYSKYSNTVSIHGCRFVKCGYECGDRYGWKMGGDLKRKC